MLMCAVLWLYILFPPRPATRCRGRDLARGARAGRRHLVLCAHGGSQCGLGQRPAHFEDRCRLQLTVRPHNCKDSNAPGPERWHYSVEVVCYHPRSSGVSIYTAKQCSFTSQCCPMIKILSQAFCSSSFGSAPFQTPSRSPKMTPQRVQQLLRQTFSDSTIADIAGLQVTHNAASTNGKFDNSNLARTVAPKINGSQPSQRCRAPSDRHLHRAPSSATGRRVA